MHRTVLLVGLLTLGPLLAACSDDDGASAVAGTALSTTTTTAVVDDEIDGPAGALTDQYLQRYCEVLVVTVGDAGAVAEVWGTQGVNDCPQEAFAGIDPAAVASEMGAVLATPNGPRYWVLDEIVANELAGSGEVRTFNGLDMRSIALVDLGAGIPDRSPFVGVSVRRDTEFVFAEGREVHELTAPDGSVYVMQSFSVEVDPTLDVEQLAELGPRLELPAGWTFTSRILDEALVVEDVDGVATIIQDPLRNSYQLRAAG